jgi:hypothetical protein
VPIISLAVSFMRTPSGVDIIRSVCPGARLLIGRMADGPFPGGSPPERQ